jgi:hypothetical protein
MDNDLLNLAARQIELFISLQQRELPKDLAAVRQSESSLSFVNSSRYRLALDDVCAKAIAKRGAAVWEILHRVITTAHVPYAPALAGQLKVFSLQYLEGNVGGLTERASLEANKNDFAVPGRESEAARDYARDVLDTEIDHFCIVLARAPQAATYQPPHVINISGGSTIASIQTGNFSNATVSMATPSTQQEAVRRALEELMKELKELHATNQDSVPLLLAEQTQNELAKSTPDRSRLEGFISAIKSCVSGAIGIAPKIPDAIEGVQKAIALLPM